MTGKKQFDKEKSMAYTVRHHEKFDSPQRTHKADSLEDAARLASEINLDRQGAVMINNALDNKNPQIYVEPQYEIIPDFPELD
ncbi:hypothetical protein L8106_30780 [Lyngbya sp. PCC 8106]|nr:hypothetical protein L8106_30780 [Lyngbya sp. PCC 8106]